jgi:hypothetical protein
VIAVDARCDNCMHCYSELLDGWRPVCAAFPKGIPAKLYLHIDPAELPECANGIGYEPIKLAGGAAPVASAVGTSAVS